MSIRPEIMGLDITKFQNMFGSVSKEEMQELLTSYEANLVVVDGLKQFYISKESDLELISEALTEGGDKAAKLETDYPDMFLSLLTSQKDNLSTDSSDWKYYHAEYFERMTNELDPAMAMLFEYFLDGRGVFIEIPTSELPYAYLTKSEVSEVLKDMEKNWETYDDPEGFGKDFKGWLEEIEAAGLDLFFIQG